MADKNATSDQRKTEGLIRDLIDLVPPKRELPTLGREEPKGGIPRRRGYAERNLQPGQGGEGGGLASPLTEGVAADPASPAAPVLDRTYYPATQFVTSDGLFVMELEPVETIKFRDANGDSAEFRIANPYAEDPAP